MKINGSGFFPLTTADITFASVPIGSSSIRAALARKPCRKQSSASCGICCFCWGPTGEISHFDVWLVGQGKNPSEKYDFVSWDDDSNPI